MSRLLLKHKLCCKVQLKTQYISAFLVCFYFARHKSLDTLKDAKKSTVQLVTFYKMYLNEPFLQISITQFAVIKDRYFINS